MRVCGWKFKQTDSCSGISQRQTLLRFLLTTATRVIPNSTRRKKRDLNTLGILLATFREWAGQKPRQNYQFAGVQRREPHVLVGCAGLRRMGHLPDEAEFGMELVPDFRGRYAYAVEIGRALLDFGFGTISLRVITGSTVRANSAITRLTEWFRAEIVATRLAPEQMPNREWASLD